MFLLAGGILSLAVRCMWFSSFPFLSYQNLKPLLVLARKRRPSQVNQPRALCIRSARQCLPYRAAVLFHPGSVLRGSYQMRRLQLKVLSPAYLNAALNIASTSKWDERAVSVPANLHPSPSHAFLSLITAKRFRAQIFSADGDVTLSFDHLWISLSLFRSSRRARTLAVNFRERPVRYRPSEKACLPLNDTRGDGFCGGNRLIHICLFSLDLHPNDVAHCLFSVCPGQMLEDWGSSFVSYICCRDVGLGIENWFYFRTT